MPARRYASAGMALCLSVCLCRNLSVRLCLSQVDVISKGTDGLIWFLAWRLPSASQSYSVFLTKFRYLQHKDTSLSGTFSLTPDLENFATA